MNIEEEYERLYNHWFQEFNESDLTRFSQEEFNNYRDLIASIDDFKLHKDGKLEHQILKKYKKNLNFLFNDLLKIRKTKIINASLSLKELELNLLTEAEKLLYQNIVASIKGFEKIKTLSINSTDKKRHIEDLNIDLKSQEITETNESILGQKDQKISEKDYIEDEDKEQIDYSLIRFLQDNPAIVGMDLLNYGPFKKEDIANIPYRNAVILVNEKIAEFISIN
jgi:DNA replication initiation complex subunit (GINS family)